MQQFLNGWYLGLTEVFVQGDIWTIECSYKPQTRMLGKDVLQKTKRLCAYCIINWINTFQADDKLCNLTSGRNGTSDISADLLGAHAKGEEAVMEFVRERLDTYGQKDFYAPIPKMKLKTSKSLDVGKTFKKQTFILRSNRELFVGRFLVIG